MPGVFICYRRDDVAGLVGRVFDRLAAHFGDGLVFMDVASLGPGEHFDAATERCLGQCDVVLVAIGARWLAAIADPARSEDFVRREVAAALRLERPIIPLLVDGVTLPPAAALPPELHPILRSHAFAIRHHTFERDVDELIAHIERQFVPLPAGARARRLERALMQAGAPYSWLAGLMRVTGPAKAVAALAALGLLGVAALSWISFDAGWDGGYESGTRDATAAYELAAAEARNERLVLRGFVTDGTQGIGDAVVQVTNQSSKISTSATTGQFGRYALDLRELDISENSILLVNVSKPPFKPSRDVIQYRDGIEHRSILMPR